MSKISPINATVKQLYNTKFIKMVNNPKSIKPNLRTLKQFQPIEEDVVELSSNFQKVYDDYKSIEEASTLMSFERKKLAKIEDTVSLGTFRDEELFDSVNDYAHRAYDIDDVSLAENLVPKMEVATVFSLDTNIDKSLQRRLKRIEIGDILVKEAAKVKGDLKYEEIPIIAEKVLNQKELGIPDEKIIKNFKLSFLNKGNQQNKKYSKDLFEYLSQNPQNNRKNVILKNINGDEIVDATFVEYFPKINKLSKDENLTAEIMEDCRVGGITDPEQCRFAETLFQIYGKWDAAIKDFLKRTVFDTVKGPKSSGTAVYHSLNCLRENNYSISKTLMNKNYTYKMKYIERLIKKEAILSDVKSINY